MGQNLVEALLSLYDCFIFLTQVLEHIHEKVESLFIFPVLIHMHAVEQEGDGLLKPFSLDQLCAETIGSFLRVAQMALTKFSHIIVELDQELKCLLGAPITHQLAQIPIVKEVEFATKLQVVWICLNRGASPINFFFSVALEQRV